MQKRSKFLINIELRLEHNMFCGGAVALYSLVGSDPLAHNRRTKLLGYDSKPPPAASSDLTEYIATRVWFRAKCCFHVFCACTREVAPDRPADFGLCRRVLRPQVFLRWLRCGPFHPNQLDPPIGGEPGALIQN